MSRQFDQIWMTLVQADLVHGPAPEPQVVILESPWYVKVLLAFSGWLAALFLLCFIGVGLEFIVESSVASCITGGAMIGCAFAILRMPKNEFFEHLGLAVSLAGQALLVFTIFSMDGDDDDISWMLVALMQMPLVLFMPSFVHRVLSCLIIVCAVSMTLSSSGACYVFSSVIMLLAAWLWLNEFRFPAHMHIIRSIGYGLVLALIPQKGTLLFGFTGMGWRSVDNKPDLWIQPWVGEVLACAVTLYVVWELLQRHGQNISGRIAIMSLLATLLLCIVSVEARGITAGMVIMLLGFAGGNRVLLGLGIVSLLFYMSSYYYLLDATLLAKAQTLLVIGLVLLVARWFMLRILPVEKEVTDV